MIWATVSSWSCFCWLYRASPSLAAKNVINLILVLTIWWCPCVESSLVLLEEGVCYASAFSWQNSVSLCPAWFCTPRPNLPVPPGMSEWQQNWDEDPGIGSYGQCWSWDKEKSMEFPPKIKNSAVLFGVGDGQGGLACCDSWGRKESDMTERLIWFFRSDPLLGI